MVTEGFPGGEKIELVIEAREELAGLRRTAASLERSARLARHLSIALGAVGAAATLAFRDAIRVINNFETQVNRVQAAVNATEQDIGRLRQQALRLGRETAFTASQAAEAQFRLAQSGYDVNETLRLMPDVLNVAAAGLLSMEEAGKILTNQVATFNLGIEESTRVADVLALTAASSKTSISELGTTFRYAAPAAAAVGVSIEETAAAIGILRDRGLVAEQAGTGLRFNILRLVKPVASAAAVFDELGMSQERVAQQIEEGKLLEVFAEFGKAGLTLNQAGRMFDVRAAGAALILSSAAQEAIQLRDALLDAEGASKRMAETQMQGLPGALLRMSSAIESLKIAFGDSGLTNFVIFLANTVRSLVNWVSSLSEGWLRFIWIAGGAITVVASIAAAFLGLRSVIRTYQAIQKTGEAADQIMKLNSLEIAANKAKETAQINANTGAYDANTSAKQRNAGAGWGGGLYSAMAGQAAANQRNTMWARQLPHGLGGTQAGPGFWRMPRTGYSNPSMRALPMGSGLPPYPRFPLGALGPGPIIAGPGRTPPSYARNYGIRGRTSAISPLAATLPFMFASQIQDIQSTLPGQYKAAKTQIETDAQSEWGQWWAKNKGQVQQSTKKQKQFDIQQKANKDYAKAVKGINARAGAQMTNLVKLAPRLPSNVFEESMVKDTSRSAIRATKIEGFRQRYIKKLLDPNASPFLARDLKLQSYGQKWEAIGIREALRDYPAIKRMTAQNKALERFIGMKSGTRLPGLIAAGRESRMLATMQRGGALATMQRGGALATMQRGGAFATMQRGGAFATMQGIPASRDTIELSRNMYRVGAISAEGWATGFRRRAGARIKVMGSTIGGALGMGIGVAAGSIGGAMLGQALGGPIGQAIGGMIGAVVGPAIFAALVASGPIGWVIAGIVGITAAIITLTKSWDKLINTVKRWASAVPFLKNFVGDENTVKSANQVVQGFSQPLPVAPQSAVMAATGNNNQQTTIMQPGAITVNAGSANAEETAMIVDRKFREMRQAENLQTTINFDNPIAA